MIYKTKLSSTLHVFYTHSIQLSSSFSQRLTPLSDCNGQTINTMGKLNSIWCVSSVLCWTIFMQTEWSLRDSTVLMVKLLANLCVGLISRTNPSLPVWTMCCSRCVSRDQIRIKKHDNIRHILYYWPPLHVRLISRAFQAVCVMELLCWIS